MTLPVAAGLWLAALGESARAATIGSGNVTADLGPTFFVDDAAAGGSDATVTQPAVASYTRSLAGMLNSNQGLTRVSLNGFGFATSSAAASNTATSLTVTFSYLGADEAVGGGDDVVMGSATGDYAYSGAGEYVFAFDSPVTADLNITGTRFRIQVAPANDTNNGKVLFKTAALAYETTNGPKLSVSGIAAPQRLNLAKYQTVVTDSVSDQRLASYVTDGVAGNDNRWQSSGGGPHWARVEFPYPVEVGSAQVFSGVDDGSAQSSFKLQYLNSSTWEDVPGAAVSNNTNVEHNLVFTAPVTASSFRIHSVDATLRIRELALYPPNGGNGHPTGTDLTLDLARQRPALATANTAGNVALLAVDGRVNEASMWQTSLAGINSLEIDLRVSTRIGSAHLYSGSPGILPLSDFVLRYWDGSAWQDIPGGSVTGSTAAALVVPFTRPVSTSKVRLEFTNPATTSVRELCIFPANDANRGYPLGTGVTGAPPSTARYDDFNDAFYHITNPTANRFIAVNNGAPGLDPSGLTAAQGQYQVLLNLGTGTYRLRNRATGYCLSGARLSTNPGDLLVDAPYSALPDQDWIPDSIDGTDFHLINQWSGLVIDTQAGGTAPGTPLVQNVNTGAASQRWRLAYSTHFPKKGIGGTSFATAFKVNWAYNWGLKNNRILPAGAVFDPMQWGDYNWDIGSKAGPNWQYYPAWRTTASSLHLMGFNEPDHTDQANMDVNKAVMLWPRLQAMDLPLLAPCPANMTGGWLASFYTQADNLGYRADYTPKHSYSGPNGGSSNNLISGLETGYTTWGRPMWLTEFGFVDWGGTASWCEEDNYNCLAEFLWRAESLPWLRKYALFVFTEDANNPEPAEPWTNVTPAPRSNSYDINGNLTPFGRLYAAWDNDASVSTDKPYYIHNKGTRKRLANTLASTANARSIRTDDASVKWTLVSTGASGRYFLVSARDGRRLLSDGTSVSMVAAGTTGTAAEWSLTENQYGWYYLGHPASSKRLKLAYSNSNGVATYTMVANTNTEDASKWRFIVPPSTPIWSGASNASWTVAGNWMPGVVPSTGDTVTFDDSSTANLNTTLDQDFSVLGVTVTSPSGPVSIGGTNRLTVGADGIDLSGASQNLTITAPVVLQETQSWSVAGGRTLSLNGGVSGSGDMTVVGEGVVSLGAANILPNGAGNGNLIVNGTLDLNGFSQAMNGLSGTGTIDNIAGGGSITLTVGNNDAAVTLNALLQNTSGTLALVKSGSGSLTLPGANTFGGGLTNNGTGFVYPRNSNAFGTGPVVMNGSTIYATPASYTFANALALNGATLRVGGGNNRTIIWNGPVTATGTSGLSADGGTGGITLADTLDITGATFGSYANGTTNTITGAISGAGGNLNVTGGTLQLSGPNTYSGTTTLGGSGVLRLQPTGTISSASNLVINTSGNFNVRNTVGWVYAGTISGDGTGSVNLNSGTNAALEGDISGVVNINANSGGTDTTISGDISGATNVTVQNGVDGSGLGAILRLGGSNSYSGATTVMRGALVLAANNVLPDATPVAIGNATLDAATFADTAGTLDVTSTATIHLGSGATLAFADSSAVDWTGGTLNLTGDLVFGGPNGSLRFGTDANGLTATQLSSISAPGFTEFALDAAGFLTVENAGTPYDVWSGGADFDADANGDGVKNGLAFLLGAADPFESANGRLPTASESGGVLVLTFNCLNSASRGSAVLDVEHSSDLGIADPWAAAAVPETSGGPVNGVSFTVTPGSPLNTVVATIPSTETAAGRLFGRLKGTP